MLRSTLEFFCLIIILGLAAGCSLHTGAVTGCSGVNFDVRPSYFCPGESVTVAWNVRPRLFPCDGLFHGCVGPLDSDVSVFLSSEPTNLFDPPESLPVVGASSVVPPHDLEITLTTIRQYLEDSITCNMRENEFLVMQTETRTHVEVFSWGCKNSRGGGPGWSSVDYDRGDIASNSIAISRVRNPNPFPILVGMRRDLPDGLVQIETIRLGIDGDTDIFNGPFFGVWQASHADPDSFGLNGCDSMTEPGEAVLPPDESVPVIISPRPDVQLEFVLICTTL